LSALFAATFIVAYILWKYITLADRERGKKPPPCIRSLPLFGSFLFLPDYRVWHKEFLKMSAKMGNVIAFYIGSRYVLFGSTKVIHLPAEFA